jgi:hypothetical protein
MISRRSVGFVVLSTVIALILGFTLFAASQRRAVRDPKLSLLLVAALRALPGVDGRTQVVFDQRTLPGELSVVTSGDGRWPADLVNAVVASGVVVLADSMTTCPVLKPPCSEDRGRNRVALSMPVVIGAHARIQAQISGPTPDSTMGWALYELTLRRDDAGWHVTNRRITSET